MGAATAQAAAAAPGSERADTALAASGLLGVFGPLFDGDRAGLRESIRGGTRTPFGEDDMIVWQSDRSVDVHFFGLKLGSCAQNDLWSE